jgi:hypothetical protein
VFAIFVELHCVQISKFEPIKMTTALGSLPLAFHFLSVMPAWVRCMRDGHLGPGRLNTGNERPCR